MNFDKQIAKELGVECAILLSNIMFWVETNMANGESKHFHNNKWWTYNTAGSFAKLFPYWKERSIYNYIEKLEKAGYIESGNFNKFKYDRTKWYTLGEKVLKNPICKKVEMDLPKITNASAKSANGFTENCGPIPDINTDKKQEDINTYILDWRPIVVYFYQKISPSTPIKFKKKITKEAAELLLSIHSRESIEKKIDWLATSDRRRFCFTFESFCAQYSVLEADKPKPMTQPMIYATPQKQTTNNPNETAPPF